MPRPPSPMSFFITPLLSYFITLPLPYYWLLRAITILILILLLHYFSSRYAFQRHAIIAAVIAIDDAISYYSPLFSYYYIRYALPLITCHFIIGHYYACHYIISLITPLHDITPLLRFSPYWSFIFCFSSLLIFWFSLLIIAFFSAFFITPLLPDYRLFCYLIIAVFSHFFRQYWYYFLHWFHHIEFPVIDIAIDGYVLFNNNISLPIFSSLPLRSLLYWLIFTLAFSSFAYFCHYNISLFSIHTYWLYYIGHYTILLADIIYINILYAIDIITQLHIDITLILMILLLHIGHWYYTHYYILRHYYTLLMPIMIITMPLLLLPLLIFIEH